MSTDEHGARGVYEVWHRQLGVDAETNTPWHQMLKVSLGRAADLAAQRVLEIGCGRGGLALWLASQQPAPALVVATDFACSAVGQGRAAAIDRGVAGLSWVTGDIEKLPYPDDTFDVAISCETIEHVPDPQRALRELARVLRPGGQLCLTAPNYLGTLGLYRLYLRVRGRRFTEEGQPINHCLVLPRTCAWVRRAGFKILAIKTSGYYLLLPRRSPIDLPRLGRPRWLMRWFGQHSLIIGVKAPAE